jgi:transcription elongation GreA/GreB family factor
MSEDPRTAETTDELEGWFLEALSASELPVSELMQVLRRLYGEGRIEQADSWAELLREALCAQGRTREVVELLKAGVGSRDGDSAHRERCRAILSDLYRGDALRAAFVASAGFAGSIPVSECFRRLDTLLRLTPGTFCQDKTWGFGVVNRLDDFYQRITVDFSRRPGHEMTFAYAAETLQPVGDDHLLARWHRDPEGLAALSRSSPGELVRIALRSHGPVTAVQLQEILTGTVLKAEEWKPFWEAARKALKDEPLVRMPTRRSDPIELLDRERAYDGAWFAALAKERNPERILERTEELAGAVAPDALAADSRRVLAERLGFVVRSAGTRDAALLARAAIAATHWGVPGEAVDVAGLSQALTTPAVFMAAASAIPSRLLGRFIALLAARDESAATALLLECLPDMPLDVLGEATDLLKRSGQEGRLRGRIQELLGSRHATPEILYWLARRPEVLAAWGLGSAGDLAFLVLAALERSYSGERLRVSNQLEALMTQGAWLEEALTAMNDEHRRHFVAYLRDGVGRVRLDCLAVLARVIARYPDLGEMMSTIPPPAPEGTRLKFTSWRTYRERQAQLEKLIKEEIPRNSREIAHARSYGDLSENFEYKAAKDHQRLLLQRRSELEQDLREVRGTDFGGAPTRVAGMGTAVVIEGAGGVRCSYAILGEWDSDEALGIISSSSRLGRALLGHGVGEEVAIPGDTGEHTARVIHVGPVGEAVQAWIRGH